MPIVSGSAVSKAYLRSFCENKVYAKPEKGAKVIAKVEDGVVGEIDKCPSKNSMCLIKFDGARGWMPRQALFGVYPDEVIK